MIDWDFMSQEAADHRDGEEELQAKRYGTNSLIWG